jgi:hypothetical protein
LNPGLHGEKLATNHQSWDTALNKLQTNHPDSAYYVLRQCVLTEDIIQGVTLVNGTSKNSGISMLHKQSCQEQHKRPHAVVFPSNAVAELLVATLAYCSEYPDFIANQETAFRLFHKSFNASENVP